MFTSAFEEFTQWKQQLLGGHRLWLIFLYIIMTETKEMYNTMNKFYFCIIAE